MKLLFLVRVDVKPGTTLRNIRYMKDEILSLLRLLPVVRNCHIRVSFVNKRWHRKDQDQ